MSATQEVIPRLTLNSTEDEFYMTVNTMACYGGSFVAALSDALSHADSVNRRRLLEAFPDVFYKYGPGSTFYNQMAAPRRAWSFAEWQAHRNDNDIDMEPSE